MKKIIAYEKTFNSFSNYSFVFLFREKLSFRGVLACVQDEFLSSYAFHSYTFDDYIGFGIEQRNLKVSQFGKIVYTSDTTAIMTYTNGRKRNIRIEWYDEKACAIWEGKEMITTLIRYSGPKEYKEDEHINIYRAIIEVEARNMK